MAAGRRSVVAVLVVILSLGWLSAQPASAAGEAIVGVVSGPDGPVQGVTVTAFFDGSSVDGVSDETGAYRIDVTRGPGLYSLSARDPKRDHAYRSGLTADVPAGGEARVDVDLQPGAEISGLLRTPDGSDPGQFGISFVSPWNPAGGSLAIGDLTTAEGSYTVRGLSPGTYVLGFYPFQPGYARTMLGGASTRLTAATVTVGVGEKVTAPATTLLREAIISGRLTGLTGQPAAYSNVTVYADLPPAPSPVDEDNWSYWGPASANANGEYTVRGLPPGGYRLRFVTSDYSTGEWYPDRATREFSEVLTVTAGQAVEHVDAVLGATSAPPPDPTPTPSPTTPPAPSPVTPSVPTTSSPAPVPSPAAALAEVVGDIGVTGKPKVGKTLKLAGLVTSLRGSVTYKVQWKAGRKAIRRATKPRLKVTSAMIGKVIKVKVTAIASGATRSRVITVGKVR